MFVVGIETRPQRARLETRLTICFWAIEISPGTPPLMARPPLGHVQVPRSVGMSHSIRQRNIPFRYDLGIDAEVSVAEGAHQRLRNGEVADASHRIDLSGGATGDAFDDFQSGVFSDRDLPPDQIEFVPGRPAAHIEIGAEA